MCVHVCVCVCVCVLIPAFHDHVTLVSDRLCISRLQCAMHGFSLLESFFLVYQSALSLTLLLNEIPVKHVYISTMWKILHKITKLTIHKKPSCQNYSKKNLEVCGCLMAESSSADPFTFLPAPFTLSFSSTGPNVWTGL